MHTWTWAEGAFVGAHAREASGDAASAGEGAAPFPGSREPDGVRGADGAWVRVSVGATAEVDLDEGSPLVREVLRDMPHAAVSYGERDASSACGIVVVPAGMGRRREAARFAFVLRPHCLALVEDGPLARPLIERLAAEGAPVEGPVDALMGLIRLLLRDQPALLSEVREDLELIEEAVLEGRERPNRALMMEDARRMFGLDTFYQGLSDIVDNLAEEGEGLASPAERLRAKALARQLDRLATRLEALQQYGLEVHSLYQESIDVHQNHVMQWLTVVTTIAMPLTFITGWYGMNFPHMALFDAAWGYPAVIVVCLAIVAAEVRFFHRRGWLRFGGGRPRRGRRDRRRGGDAA